MKLTAVESAGAWRRQAVLRVVGVLFCLLLAACDTDKALHDVMGKFTPPSPGQTARDAFNIYDADTRRRAIAMLSAAKFGGESVYVRVYRLLVDDPDATVRAAAIKALGEHGTVEDAKLIAARLKDDAAFVRWESAKALQRIHNTDVVAPLVDVTKDEDADVRMAAATALGQYPGENVIHVLIGLLDDPEFAVAESARQSLHTLTGEDFGTDGPAWLRWVEGNNKNLFRGQQRYVFMPYVKPRGFWAKMEFWKKVPKVEPREPTGMETAATTQPATQPAS